MGANWGWRRLFEQMKLLSGAADDPRYYQISVPVQPGNSGGALVDDRGPAMRDELRGQESRMAGLSLLESVPAVSAKLKAPVTADRKFEDVVKSAQDAAVLVLVY
jgi:hypothetical protein